MMMFSSSKRLLPKALSQKTSNSYLQHQVKPKTFNLAYR